MKNTFYFRLVVLFFFATLVFACKDDKEEDITPNNPQPQVCDTNNITYTNTVSGLISSNCLSCHSTSSASGGVILDTHARLKQIADNGKLMGVITHAAGFKPMPQGGPKLSDCNIAKIKKWVDAGAPNN